MCGPATDKNPHPMAGLVNGLLLMTGRAPPPNMMARAAGRDVPLSMGSRLYGGQGRRQAQAPGS